jgi:hypothetical protein
MTPEALLAEVAEAGGRIEVHGDRLRLTAPKPLPLDLVARIRDAKSALLAALDGPTDWRARYHKAMAHWGALHPPVEAAGLAWGELLTRWHRLRGARTPEWQCAGCGSPIGGLPALTLSDGARVHFDRLDCLIRYGERWRRAATAGLRVLGLDPPPDGTDRGDAWLH